MITILSNDVKITLLVLFFSIYLKIKFFVDRIIVCES